MRGNVVSDAAAKLIQTLLLNTMATSGKQADDAESEADDSADDTELPPLKLPGNKFLKLLHSKEDEDSIPGKCIASMKNIQRRRVPVYWNTNIATVLGREYGALPRRLVV